MRLTGLVDAILPMSRFLQTELDLQAGLANLITADPQLKPIAEKAGAFSLCRRGRMLCLLVAREESLSH
jgi:hypothetical protein